MDEHASHTWTPTTAQAVMQEPGTYLRCPDRAGRAVEGRLIRGRPISVDGVALGVQLALRTPDGRMDLTVAPGCEVTALRPTLSDPGIQLAAVDELVVVLGDLEAVGCDEVRGYQTPAMRRVTEALVSIRAGEPGAVDRLTGATLPAGGGRWATDVRGEEAS
jgi:hypothetical protein